MESRRGAAALAATSVLVALGATSVAAGRDGAAGERGHGAEQRSGHPSLRAAVGAVTEAERPDPPARATSWPAAAGAVRTERPAAHHPVDEDSDYGDAGAAFGAERSGHVHEGQDVFAPAGTPLVAVRDGEVVEAGSDAARGNHLSIYSEEADRTYVYFHLLSPATAEVGERVRGGERVGELGCTGSCYGDHLHFEVHEGRGAEAPAIDPLPLLRRWE